MDQEGREREVANVVNYSPVWGRSLKVEDDVEREREAFAHCGNTPPRLIELLTICVRLCYFVIYAPGASSAFDAVSSRQCVLPYFEYFFSLLTHDFVS